MTIQSLGQAYVKFQVIYKQASTEVVLAVLVCLHYRDTGSDSGTSHHRRRFHCSLVQLT